MPGRKPIPKSLKVLKGTHQKCRDKKNGMEPQEGVPAPPEWLSKEGLNVWNSVVDSIGSLGVISMADGAMLALYSEEYGQYVKDRQAGVEIATARIAQIRALASSFGLEPSSRQKISVIKPEKKADPKERFFK